MAWDLVCQAKEEGGLDLRISENISLLGKRMQRFSTETYSLW